MRKDALMCWLLASHLSTSVGHVVWLDFGKKSFVNKINHLRDNLLLDYLGFDLLRRLRFAYIEVYG